MQFWDCQSLLQLKHFCKNFTSKRLPSIVFLVPIYTKWPNNAQFKKKELESYIWIDKAPKIVEKGK